LHALDVHPRLRSRQLPFPFLRVEAIGWVSGGAVLWARGGGGANATAVEPLVLLGDGVEREPPSIFSKLARTTAEAFSLSTLARLPRGVLIDLRLPFSAFLVV